MQMRDGRRLRAPAHRSARVRRLQRGRFARRSRSSNARLESNPTTSAVEALVGSALPHGRYEEAEAPARQSVELRRMTRRFTATWA